MSFGSCQAWFIFCWGWVNFNFSLSLTVQLMLKNLIILAKTYPFWGLNYIPRMLSEVYPLWLKQSVLQSYINHSSSIQCSTPEKLLFARYFNSSMHAQPSPQSRMLMVISALSCFVHLPFLQKPCTEILITLTALAPFSESFIHQVYYPTRAPPTYTMVGKGLLCQELEPICSSSFVFLYSQGLQYCSAWCSKLKYSFLNYFSWFCNYI